MTTFEDSAVYEYCELLYQELEKNDAGYYPSKHDEFVFNRAASNFGISIEKAKEIYNTHNKLAANIEVNRINTLPPMQRQKARNDYARNIMLNNRDLPFHKIEGPPSKPLPLSIETLENEYKMSLIKMAKCGWTIPLSMGFARFNEIIPFADDEEKIDTYFLRYYGNKEFNNMCKHIEKTLVNPAHKQCFYECIKSYNEKMYTICLTALATILEGVLSLYGENPNDVRMMRICQHHADESIRKNQKIKSLSWLSMYEFIKILFEKSDFDKAEPDKRNRHWLLHGRTSKLGKQVDCIRLFNAISTLAAIKTFEEKIK